MTEDLSHHPLIVGAGPAGLAAAAVLQEAGRRPIILDEAPQPGGQGTRRLSPAMEGSRHRLFGRAAQHMSARERREDALLAKCDYRAGTLVWGAFGDEIEVMRDGRLQRIKRGPMIIASGAMDRIFPIPGWTLPGVYSIGAAQIALKRDACFIGRRVVFAGSSPLLYLAAVQYLRAGGHVAAVLDTTARGAKLRAAPGMALRGPRTLLDGLSMMLELRRAGIPIKTGVTLEGFEGGARVDAVRYRIARDRDARVECDAVAFGYGLRAESQLAELAGASFDFDMDFRQWFPKLDIDGRAGERLWLAGDGARIGGAAAAACAGRLAALSLLASEGANVPRLEIRRLRARLARWHGFQRAMARAFAPPTDGLRDLPDAAVLCRCERVSVGEVRQAIALQQGPVEVNRVKAITRCGMGRCQGRLCGLALAELTAGATGQTLEAVGRLRAQAPIRPIPVAAARRAAMGCEG